MADEEKEFDPVATGQVEFFDMNFKCEVCGEAHPTYHCCDKCNYDTHVCMGCGDMGHHICPHCTE